MSTASTSRSRSRRRALAAAAWALALFAPSCGTKTDLPVETRGGRLLPGTYGLKHVWEDVGSVTDILITSSGDLFLSVDSAEVRQYYRTSSPQLGPTTFQGLTRPFALAESARETLFVADLGPPATVYKFRPGGGAPIDSIRDPAWGRITGIAADAEGWLYVGARVITAIDAIPPDTATYSVDQIRKYSPGFDSIAVLRQFDVFSTPLGMNVRGASLLIAKQETGELERISAEEGTRTELLLEDPLVFPQDVETDDSLSIFVADAGAGKVYRFSWLGELLSTIPDPADADTAGPFVRPAAVTAAFDFLDGRSEIWVADPGARSVKRWKITKENVE